MATFSNLWKEASKSYKPLMNNKDYAIIIISSAVSAGVSFFASQSDWSKTILTKIPLIDMALVLLFLSAIVFGIIWLFLWIMRMINIIQEFCGLVWKKWQIKKRK